MSKQRRIGQQHNPQRIPTTEKLAKALEEVHAPPLMIEQARAGHYDDYKSDLATPIVALVNDAKRNGLYSIAERAMRGDFDAQNWEGDAWAEGPEGQAIMKEFFKGMK